MQAPLFQSAMTTLLNASFCVMVGILATRFWLARGDDVLFQYSCRRLASALRLALLTGIVATLLSLWQASASMADVTLRESGPALWASFATTHYGMAGLASLGFLGVAALVDYLGTCASAKSSAEPLPHPSLQSTLQSSPQPPATPATPRWVPPVATTPAQPAAARVVPVLLLGFAICRVSAGHAAEDSLWSVAALVELLHLLLMALWAGCVLIAAWGVLPRLQEELALAARRRYLPLLSRVATAALAGIVGTGVYNACRVLSAPADLLHTGYGLVLAVKLGFVALAIALAGWNRLVGFPSLLAASRTPLETAGDLRKAVAVLRLESLALLIVLAAAAVLAGSQPPSVA